MSSFMHRLRGRAIFIYVVAGVTLTIIGVTLWIFQLQSQIGERLKNGWFVAPIEYFGRADRWVVHQKFSRAQLQAILLEHGYTERPSDRRRSPGDFSRLNPSECKEKGYFGPIADDDLCLVIVRRSSPFGSSQQDFALRFDAQMTLTEIFPAAEVFEFEPQRFAQFFGTQLILRDVLPLGTIPLSCLQAVTAIEDSDFLNHPGVSLSGTVRAIARNLRHGRFAEGGSTITQQLVKNAFLSHKKTLGRKLTEQMMALLIEGQFNKDQILQAYLNEIYMGQSGSFEIRGFGAASTHYFGKSIGDLELSECALLAALINSPGRYNPFVHPQAATLRRALVLERMENLKMIDHQQQSEANGVALPKNSPHSLVEPSPYVVREINQTLKDIPVDQGLQVLTAIDLQAQATAQRVIREGIETIERNRKNHQLEAALVSLDVATGQIFALVGGRDYKQTQLNRIFDSHRQVGSTIKPFIYLTAFEAPVIQDQTFSPLTPLEDAPFSYKYQGQTWTPHNYESDFHGRVPAYYALKESLNVPTVKLGINVGIDNIVELAHRAGIDTQLDALPSLTLGAVELKPIELAKAYLTLARMGSKIEPTMVIKVQTLDGHVLMDRTQMTAQQVFKVEDVALVLGLLKTTFISGTAQSAQALGFHDIAAGKTGTTSDLKDSWFVGMTPHVLTLVWVGYDNNLTSGLTGATGALPLWVRFMTTALPPSDNKDFAWPSSVIIRHVEATELQNIFDKVPASESSGVDLVFRK